MLSKQLTIVIPTYNEEKYIAQTLYAIAAQSKTKGIKIIIADAKSTDSTRAIVLANSFELNLNLEIIDGGLPAVGRNAGAKLATTPYVLFLDDNDSCFYKFNEFISCPHHKPFPPFFPKNTDACTAWPRCMNGSARTYLLRKHRQVVLFITPYCFNAAPIRRA